MTELTAQKPDASTSAYRVVNVLIKLNLTSADLLNSVQFGCTEPADSPGTAMNQ